MFNAAQLGILAFVENELSSKIHPFLFIPSAVRFAIYCWVKMTSQWLKGMTNHRLVCEHHMTKFRRGEAWLIITWTPRDCDIIFSRQQVPKWLPPQMDNNSLILPVCSYSTNTIFTRISCLDSWDPKEHIPVKNSFQLSSCKLVQSFCVYVFFFASASKVFQCCYYYFCDLYFLVFCCV